VYIPHSRPRLGHSSQAVIAQVLSRAELAIGPHVQELETKLQQLCQQGHAVAVDTGTSAISLLLRAYAQRQHMQRIGIPAYACASLLYAVQAAGMQPVLMDCQADLRLVPEQARQQAEQLDAIIMVHPFGMLEPLVAEDWPCILIEDIAQAAGGRLQQRPVGSFGDACIVSFYATKPWGGAYGGMVLSNNADCIQAIKNMRSADHYQHKLDYAANHQLSNIHAALALERLQLAKHEQQQRQQYSQLWQAACQHSQFIDPGIGANAFRHLIWLDDAEQSMQHLRQRGIQASLPVPRNLADLSQQAVPKGTEAAQKHCLSLPLLSYFNARELDYMQEQLHQCC